MLEKYINGLGQLPLGINFMDILVLIILILILTHIIGSINRRSLRYKIENLPGLKRNEELIDVVKKNNERLDNFDLYWNEAQTNISFLKSQIKKIKSIETVKYNPYQDMGVGGNQSFSTAMIDKNGDGIIITALYSRERTRTLLKEVENFNSTQELAPEEKEVLNQIKNN